MSQSASIFGKCLKGKVAIVTGAARGIGRAAAIKSAQAGATVVGIDICGPAFPESGVTPSRLEDLSETGRSLTSEGVQWHQIQLDQRDLHALKAAALEIEKKFGGIDIVFANAGVQGFKPLLEIEDHDWHTQIDINLTGTANVILALPLFYPKEATDESLSLP